MPINSSAVRDLIYPGLIEHFAKASRAHVRANLFFRMRAKAVIQPLDQPYSVQMWRVMEAAIEEGCDPEAALALMEGYSHVVE